MALRAAYVDLDGTLLGTGGNLFGDAQGAFSPWPARTLQAADRAGVELVVMSGRREAQVAEAARLMGQGSHIHEAGCGVTIEDERMLLLGDFEPREGLTVCEQMAEDGVPALLLDRYSGRLEWHEPWHTGRELTHLFRGLIDVGEANRVLENAGHGDVALIDNGRISREMEGLDRAHAYHLLPKGASKANAVEFHRRARGYAREECIAIGDSLEDLGAAAAVDRFFCVANGPARDPGLREAISSVGNATVTEGEMGEGVYQAIVGTLAEGR